MISASVRREKCALWDDVARVLPICLGLDDT